MRGAQIMEFGNLRIKSINCYVNYIPKSSEWTAKNRNDHIIGVKLSGKSFHDLGYKTHISAENNVFFLNQRDDYNVKVNEIGETLSIHFTTYEPISTDSFFIELKDTKKFITLFEKAKTKSISDSYNENLSLSYVYMFCAELENARTKQYTPSDIRISVIKEYIDLHFREKDCLKNATENSNISRRRFNELFRNQFNITPNRYITELKISFSKQLLKTNVYSIAEVSEMCGFSDIYYFSKVFKNETGFSPAQFKKATN